jgi:hypothetical protein
VSLNICQKAVPVLIAGMWPGVEGEPETGTVVAILKEEGGPTLLQGYSDSAGDFHGRLPAIWVGKDVIVVVLDPGFKYDYFNPVRVQRWGLFLPVKQEPDTVYNGRQGAKNTDPHRWSNWDSTQEHINATDRIQRAVRRAKIAWPVNGVGLFISFVLGVGGFFLHPVVGLSLGVMAFFFTAWLSNRLLLHGY